MRRGPVLIAQGIVITLQDWMIRSGAPRTGERSQTKWLWVGRPTLDIVGPVRNHTGYSLNTKRSVGEPAEGSIIQLKKLKTTTFGSSLLNLSGLKS